jgi:hypothetical protein
VKKRRIAIGVAMGYRVVSSNPEFDVHPFLRSWIAEREALVVGNRQQCIGIAMLGLQAVNPCLPSALIPSTWMSAAEFGIGHSAYKLRCMVDVLYDSWMCYHSRGILKRSWGRYAGMRVGSLMVILSDRGCESITDRRCGFLVR